MLNWVVTVFLMGIRLSQTDSDGFDACIIQLVAATNHLTLKFL